MLPSSGDPSALWVVIMVLVAMGCGKISFLQWNRQKADDGNPSHENGYYTPTTIDVSEYMDFGDDQ